MFSLSVFFFSNFKRTCRFEFFCFFKTNACALRYKFAMANYITDLGMRKTSREAADPRVIRRHRIGAMASVASHEVFLLMGRA